MNDSQLERLSETLANTGLLLIGSMVIPALAGAEKVELYKALSSLGVGLGFIILSLILLKGVKQ